MYDFLLLRFCFEMFLRLFHELFVKNYWLLKIFIFAPYKQFKDDVIDCYETVENPLDYPETIIPIEKANGNFLFLVSCDDRNWKSEMYADLAVEHLEKAGRKNYLVSDFNIIFIIKERINLLKKTKILNIC